MVDEKYYARQIFRKQIITGDHFKDPSKYEHVIKHLGKYELLSKLGEGAAGEVYMAYDTSLSRHVAIKILQRMNKQDIQRFQREAEYLAKMNHPNIIQIYEVAEFQGQPYIAMQYIHGESPDKMNLNINQALSVIKQVAQALQYAHSLSIIHRDIKPTNIVIDKNFRAYLMDFGIAKQVIDKTSTISITGSIIGTPAFMSPEQARGETHNIDPRTDIYGLGSTLYYLVTRREPFKGSSTIEIINKVQSEEPTDPRKINKQIPSDVEAIILKAMAKEKSSRYQAVSAFIHDIDLYLSGEPVMAKRTSIAPRVIKKIKRRKTSIFVLLFLIALLSVTFFYINNERKKQKLQQEALSLIDEGLRVLDQAQKKSYHSESDPARIREQLEKAIVIFSQAIEKYLLARTYYYRGRIYRELARYKDAERDLTKAISADPTMNIARVERAYARILGCVSNLYTDILESEDIAADVASYIAEALRDIENIEEGSLSEEARQMRLFIYAVKKVTEKRFEDAVNLLTQSKGWQDNEDFLHWLGVVYCQKKDLDSSIEYQTRAIKNRPHFALCYLSRASAYLGKQELMKALDDLDRAIYINPSLAGAYLTRGSIYNWYNQIDKALDDFNMVTKLIPDSDKGFINRGHVFWKKGDLDAALKDFNKAIELNPKSAKAYTNRAIVFDDLKEYDKALNDYDKALTIKKSHYLTYYNRGWTYFHMSDLDRALSDFQRCIELNPGYLSAYINAGNMLAQKNDKQSALSYYNMALQINKNYALGYKVRGLFYLNIGSFDLAKDDLQKAIELDPNLRQELEPFLDQIKKRER